MDTFHRHGETLEKMFQEPGGRIGAVLLESLHITPTGIFVYSSILIELFSFGFIDQTAGGDEFYVDLDPLSGIGHLFIRFRNVLGIWELFSSQALFFKETIKPGDGTLIAPLHELDPEDDQTGMRVTPAHIPDEPDLLRGMLIWMRMGTSGTIPEGVPGAIIAFFPTVDILPVCFIFSGSVGNTVAFSIFNQ